MEHIEACPGRIVGSERSVFRSYIFTPATWVKWPTRERLENWVTPRIPADVSLKCWDPFVRIRLVYSNEPNSEKTGVRGLFGVTHEGRAGYGVHFYIGHPISPALYTYVNTSMGESGVNFALYDRYASWVAAVIGGFEDAPGDRMGGTFVVHYNDDGKRYQVVRLSYEEFTNYMRTVLPDKLRDISWPVPDGLQGPTTVHGDILPLDMPASSSTSNPAAATPLPLDLPADVKTEEKQPLVNETFLNVDMKRFWPQFMVALEMALFSPIGSRDMLALLSSKQHWPAISAYMSDKRGSFPWIAPKYADGPEAARPDYLSP